MMRFKIALILGLLALTAAACGDTEDDGGVASAGDDPSASESAADDEGLDGFEAALAYSACMRDNGIDQFPDPEQSGDGGMTLSVPEGIDPEDEDFKAAEEACEDLLPGPEAGATVDPEVYEALVEYSECMRENGVEDFPDPEPSGGIRFFEELTADSEFAAAEEACEDLRPYSDEGPQNDSEDE